MSLAPGSNSRPLQWMDRHAVAVFALFSISFLAATFWHAETKPFWNDEIYTVVHARMPSVSDMWRASTRGFDLMPPLNALLVRATVAVLGEGRATTRLPAIIGYWIACLVVFLVVRRRAGVTMALIGVELFALTATYRFAYETRGYGLLLGFSVLALYAWSEAAAGRRRGAMTVLIAASLAASVWAHYFGVLTFAVIGIAELWRDWQRRRLDLPIWFALVAAFLAFLPLLWLVGLVHRHTTSYWGTAQHFGLGSVYAFIFLPVPDWGIVAALAVVAFVALVCVFALEGKGRTSGPEAPDIPSYEVAAWVVLATLPIIGLAVVSVVGSGLVPRYFLLTAASTVAIPVLLNYRRISAEKRLLLAAIATFAWLAQAGQVFMPGQNTFKDPARGDADLMAALSGSEPVVVANAVQYFQLWFYTPPELRSRLLYLVDDDLAVRRLGSNTADASLVAVKQWCDVHTEPFATFITPGRRFQVYDADDGWLMGELRARHVRLEPGPADTHRRFFHATVPAA